MYIVINNDNVYIKKNLKELNKKLQSEFKQEEFKNYNSNYILNINNDDLDYKRDVHELNKVFINKLYKKDASNLINYAFYFIILLLLVIIMARVSGVNGVLMKLIEQLSKVVV